MVGRLPDESAQGKQFGIIIVDSNEKCDRASGSRKAGLDTSLPTCSYRLICPRGVAAWMHFSKSRAARVMAHVGYTYVLIPRLITYSIIVRDNLKAK